MHYFNTLLNKAFTIILKHASLTGTQSLSRFQDHLPEKPDYGLTVCLYTKLYLRD